MGIFSRLKVDLLKKKGATPIASKAPERIKKGPCVECEALGHTDGGCHS